MFAGKDQNLKCKLKRGLYRVLTHNRDNYAIYDSFVNKVLIAYKRKDSFSTFIETDLKNYTKFKEVVLDFKQFYNLTDHDLKQIDKFLWIYGKEKFPANYRQK
jgi:hypothetical protein